MAKLEMAENIDVKICHLIPKCRLLVGYPILLSKNQMSKNKSNLEMDIFPHFKFFHTVRPRDTRPQAARTLQVHVFELGPKISELNVFM